MTKILKVLKGTKDILPQEINMWQFVEQKACEVFSKYGFKEIRTPIIEVTELFSRGVGDTTDIVNKEMYTFEKSDRSITLRPEIPQALFVHILKTVCQEFQHRLNYGITDQCLDTKDRKLDVKDNSIKLVLKCLVLNNQLLMLRLF